MEISRPLLLAFVAFRIASTFIVTTSFVPDEYWQSLEVAHRLVFGYGYLTWEWHENIRSYCYPIIIALIYKLLQLLDMDCTTTLILCPRLLQAVTSGIADYFAYLLSRKIHGPNAANWTAFCIFSSWFLFYTSTRTLTNVAETAASTIALYFYPWPETKQTRSFNYLWFAAAAFLFRPTAAILWMPLFTWHILRTPFKIKLIDKALKTGFTALAVMTFIDWWCSGHCVLTPYNFLRFNWLYNIGAFYGSHPWHWYVSQGIPAVLSVHVIPLLVGISKKQLLPLYGIISVFLLMLSTLSHKEFRFLLPIVHPIMCICGAMIASFARSKAKAVFAAILLLLGNLPLALYCGLVHQRGTLQTMEFLANEAEKSPNDTSLLFLMPCHSTPLYSHVHRNISMRFLTCEPSLDGGDSYEDEADAFYRNYSTWLKENIAYHPTHIVLFDVLEAQLSEFLSGYRRCNSAFHTHFPEGRVGEYVLVFCRIAS